MIVGERIQKIIASENVLRDPLPTAVGWTREYATSYD